MLDFSLGRDFSMRLQAESFHILYLARAFNWLRSKRKPSTLLLVLLAESLAAYFSKINYCSIACENLNCVTVETTEAALVTF